MEKKRRTLRTMAGATLLLLTSQIPLGSAVAQEQSAAGGCCTSLESSEEPLRLVDGQRLEVAISGDSPRHKFSFGSVRYRLIELAPPSAGETENYIEFAVTRQSNLFNIEGDVFVPAFHFLDADRRLLKVVFGTDLEVSRDDSWGGRSMFGGPPLVGTVAVPTGARYLALSQTPEARAKDVVEIGSKTPGTLLPVGGVFIALPGGKATVYRHDLSSSGVAVLRRALSASTRPLEEINAVTALPAEPATATLVVGNDADCPYAWRERGTLRLWLDSRSIGSIRVGEYIKVSVTPGTHALVSKMPGETGGMSGRTKFNVTQELVLSIDPSRNFQTRHVSSVEHLLPGSVEVGSGRDPRCMEAR